MKRLVAIAIAAPLAALAVAVVYEAMRIERQSTLDEARSADLILVLGAAEYRGHPSPVLKARLDHALELFERRLAPLIMTTGGAGGDPVFTEGGVGRDYLIGCGVPAERIIVETEGDSTMYSTSFAGEVMRRMGLHSAIVVSDGYHIYRVKRMLQLQGMKVYGSPRKERVAPGEWRERWNYVKQAIGYVLWRAGVRV